GEGVARAGLWGGGGGGGSARRERNPLAGPQRSRADRRPGLGHRGRRRGPGAAPGRLADPVRPEPGGGPGEYRTRERHLAAAADDTAVGGAPPRRRGGWAAPGPSASALPLPGGAPR